MLKHFVQIGSWEYICNFHVDTPSASPSFSSSSFHLLHPCSLSISPSLNHFLHPLLYCSLSVFLLTPHPLSPSVLSQSITLSFLPWRQYYQCIASGKLHPESFLELEIGVVLGWRLSCRKRRACFTHQPVPDSRDSSSFLPPVLRHAVISSPTHSHTANRKPLEGHCEQNEWSGKTGPPDAEGSL